MLARIPRLPGRQAVILVVIGVTLLGLGLRLWLAWRANQWLPNTPDRLVGDEPGYDWLASELVQGRFFEWPGRTPVYPMFLALCYVLFGHSYAAVLYAQAFVGAAAIPLTYRLARRFVGPRSSLLAAGLIALNPALAYHVTRLYSEILYTPLLLLAVLSLLWALEAQGVRRYVLAGALLAIANLCRPTALFLPAIVPILLPGAWSLRRRVTLFAAYAGAMVAVIAPWTYHNYRTYNTFLPLSVSTALLWQGSPEFYHLMEQKRTLLQVWDEQLNPARNGGHNAFTIEGDRYFTARAIDSIRAEPDVYAGYVLQKMAFLWIGHPANDWASYAIFSVEAMRPYFSTLRLIGIFAARLVPIAALVALVILRRRLRLWVPLLALCAYFTLAHAITYAEVRYSEPLHPILAVFIAAAVSRVAQPKDSPNRATQAIQSTV